MIDFHSYLPCIDELCPYSSCNLSFWWNIHVGWRPVFAFRGVGQWSRVCDAARWLAHRRNRKSIYRGKDIVRKRSAQFGSLRFGSEVSQISRREARTSSEGCESEVSVCRDKGNCSASLCLVLLSSPVVVEGTGRVWPEIFMYKGCCTSIWAQYPSTLKYKGQFANLLIQFLLNEGDAGWCCEMLKGVEWCWVELGGATCSWKELNGVDWSWMVLSVNIWEVASD